MAASRRAAGGRSLGAFHRVNPTYLAILRLLWDAGEPRSIREMFQELRRRGPCSYPTVLTSVRLMLHGGLLERTRRGNSYVFRPTIRSEQAAAACVEDLLRAVFAGSLRDGLIAALKHLPLSAAERDAIRAGSDVRC